MSRRKKDKVKAARAREAERIANKATDTSENVQDGISTNNTPFAVDVEEQAKPARLKDSRGRKIPTESERRAKGQIDNSRTNSKEMNSPKIKVVRRKKTPKEVLLTIASHPFLVLVSVVVAIVIISAVISTIQENIDTPNTAPEEQKSISLIGLTAPAKFVLDDTGKFNGFFETEDGIAYDDLFDRLVDAKEQEILESRGQAMDVEKYDFAYNEEISSAKEEKDAAAETKLTDAGTKENSSSTSEPTNNDEKETKSSVFD